jgi:hypothetical protein
VAWELLMKIIDYQILAVILNGASFGSSPIENKTVREL